MGQEITKPARNSRASSVGMLTTVRECAARSIRADKNRSSAGEVTAMGHPHAEMPGMKKKGLLPIHSRVERVRGTERIPRSHSV